MYKYEAQWKKLKEGGGLTKDELTPEIEAELNSRALEEGLQELREVRPHSRHLPENWEEDGMGGYERKIKRGKKKSKKNAKATRGVGGK